MSKDDYSQINSEYLYLLYQLVDSEDIIINGKKCKEILHQTIELEDINQNIVSLKGFETNIKYAKEELNWYISGTNKIDFSPLIKKTWEKYSDDGITVNSNYGYRIFGNHPSIYTNQWNWVIGKFLDDINTRQAVININSAFDKIKPTKDFPCTISIQCFIRNKKLIWMTTMRSQDIYYGMRNDIYCFTELQKLMGKQLKIVGIPIESYHYIHTCHSLHIYEEQYEKMNKLLDFFEQ